jgi:TRAP-type C4-dicarboxylate transport system permease small subunit
LEAEVLITIVTAMTVAVLLQVIFRYVFNHPLSWSEELSRYLFIWIFLLGASFAVHRRSHFGMDSFFKMLPDKGRHFLIFIIDLFMGVVILLILVQGIVLVRNAAAQLSPAMRISMSWAYASLPAGAALMAIHLFTIFLKDALNYYRLKAVGLNIGLKPSKRGKKPKTLKDWPSASIIII